jgi:HD-like signal output (HDOD) protein
MPRSTAVQQVPHIGGHGRPEIGDFVKCIAPACWAVRHSVEKKGAADQVSSPQLQPEPNVAFEFVRSLAGELSSGKIDLPSFPEIAVRVRKLLADPESTIEQVVRVVGSEPALAARLIRVSNASAFNRSGKPVADLRTAINRIGYTMVRSAAMAFAMSQMRRNAKLEPLQARLDVLWQRSTLVSALSYVLARTCTKINPDEAMLTGMMHGLGKLYIMTRAAQHPELFVDERTLDEVCDSWHAQIGRSILENWDFSELMASAVGDQEDFSREEEVEADLRDIVAMAVLMASYFNETEGLELAIEGQYPTIRLGLDAARIKTVMEDCATEVSALSEALGA